MSEVLPGGNAEAAGLRGGDRDSAVRYGRTVIYLGGDIIVAVDGSPVHSIANLYEALEDNEPGETVTVEYIRGRRRRETTGDARRAARAISVGLIRSRPHSGGPAVRTDVKNHANGEDTSMPDFRVEAQYQPAGDQAQAIKALSAGGHRTGQVPDAQGCHRVGKNLHDGQDH